MTWKRPSPPTPKKFKAVPSAGKIMASLFWDSQELVIIEYLNHEDTITGTLYAEQLKKLRKEVRGKRRGKLAKVILFHQDNAFAHTSKVVMAPIQKAVIELIEHPPYCFLFPWLKEHLDGQKFEDGDALVAAVHDFFRDQEEDFLGREF